MNIILNFSGIYREQVLPGRYLTMSDIPGTNGYCSEEAAGEIRKRLAGLPPGGLHFLDNGNYHYITRFFLEKMNEPFDLIVRDHHTDMQPPALGEILSCGSWILHCLENRDGRLAALRRVLLIGPPRESVPSPNPEAEPESFFLPERELSGAEQTSSRKTGTMLKSVPPLRALSGTALSPESGGNRKSGFPERRSGTSPEGEIPPESGMLRARSKPRPFADGAEILQRVFFVPQDKTAGRQEIRRILNAFLTETGDDPAGRSRAGGSKADEQGSTDRIRGQRTRFAGGSGADEQGSTDRIRGQRIRFAGGSKADEQGSTDRIRGQRTRFAGGLDADESESADRIRGHKTHSAGGSGAGRPEPLPVYLSVDKDVLSPAEVKLNWDQGEMSADTLEIWIGEIFRRFDVRGMDVCGEPSRFDASAGEIAKSEAINKRLAAYYTKQ